MKEKNPIVIDSDGFEQNESAFSSKKSEIMFYENKADTDTTVHERKNPILIDISKLDELEQNQSIFLPKKLETFLCQIPEPSACKKYFRIYFECM